MPLLPTASLRPVMSLVGMFLTVALMTGPAFAAEPPTVGTGSGVVSFSWIDVLLSQGPAGLLAAVFAAAAWNLWKENKDLRKAHDEERANWRKATDEEREGWLKASNEERSRLQAQIDASNKARLDDAKAVVPEMLKLADRVHETTDKLADAFDALRGK